MCFMTVGKLLFSSSVAKDEEEVALLATTNYALRCAWSNYYYPMVANPQLKYSIVA